MCQRVKYSLKRINKSKNYTNIRTHINKGSKQIKFVITFVTSGNVQTLMRTAYIRVVRLSVCMLFEFYTKKKKIEISLFFLAQVKSEVAKKKKK